MDYSFHMAVNTWNDKVAADMADLVAQGINSFKFFMAYKVSALLLACGSALCCSCCANSVCQQNAKHAICCLCRMAWAFIHGMHDATNAQQCHGMRTKHTGTTCFHGACLSSQHSCLTGTCMIANACDSLHVQCYFSSSNNSMLCC